MHATWIVFSLTVYIQTSLTYSTSTAENCGGPMIRPLQLLIAAPGQSCPNLTMDYSLTKRLRRLLGEPTVFSSSQSIHMHCLRIIVIESEELNRPVYNHLSQRLKGGQALNK